MSAPLLLSARGRGRLTEQHGGKRRCANSPPTLYLMFLTKASISPTPLPNIAQPASAHPSSGTNRLWNLIVRMLGTDAQTLGMMRRVRLYSKIKCQTFFSRRPRNWTVVSKHLLAIDRRLLGACFLWYINRVLFRRRLGLVVTLFFIFTKVNISQCRFIYLSFQKSISVEKQTLNHSLKYKQK